MLQVTPFEFDSVLRAMVEASQKASEVIVQNYRQNNTVTYKSSHQDVVTEIDKRSQQIIRDHIIAALVADGIAESDIGFIGEEGLEEVRGKYLFAIDPIDGTTNFASGIDYFAVSIGCYENQVVKYGVMHNPIRNIFYISQKGKGAYKIVDEEITKLEMKAVPLEQSILSTYIHAKPELFVPSIQFLSAHALKFRAVRIMGAGVLDFGQLAENSFQICLYRLSQLWDFSAAKLLIEEAGGQLVDLEMKEIEVHFDQPNFPYQVLGGHPDLVKQVGALLKE